MADGTELLAVLVKEFGGERTAAYAGAVGFEDAVNLAYAGRGHTQAGADASAESIGRSDVGVGAEVNVQEGALGALGQDGRAGFEGFVHVHLGVDEGEAPELLHGLEPLFLVLFEVERGLEGRVLLEQLAVTLLMGLVEGQEVLLEDVTHAKAAPAGFVGIGGADALEGRANLGFAHGAFAGSIQGAVGGKDEVGALGDDQFAAYVNAPFLDGGDFLHEDDGIHDDAVTNNINGTFAEYTGGYRVQYKAVSVEDQRVTGVRAALETGNHLVGRREHVHNLTFALVPPLESENYVKFFLFHELLKRVTLLTCTNLAKSLQKEKKYFYYLYLCYC